MTLLSLDEGEAGHIAGECAPVPSIDKEQANESNPFASAEPLVEPEKGATVAGPIDKGKKIGPIASMNPDAETEGASSAGSIEKEHAIECDPTANVGPAAETQEESIVVDPFVGMEFDSETKAKEFYENYAMRVGFGSKVHSSRSCKSRGRTFVHFACDRQGSKNLYKKLKREEVPGGAEIKRRPERANTRCGCLAGMKIKLNTSGKWTVCEVELQHNHSVSPSSAEHLRSLKELKGVKRRLELCLKSGQQAQKIAQEVILDAREYENLTFPEKSCQNHVTRLRRLEPYWRIDFKHIPFFSYLPTNPLTSELNQRYNVLYRTAIQCVAEGAISEQVTAVALQQLQVALQNIRNAVEAERLQGPDSIVDSANVDGSNSNRPPETNAGKRGDRPKEKGSISVKARQAKSSGKKGRAAGKTPHVCNSSEMSVPQVAPTTLNLLNSCSAQESDKNMEEPQSEGQAH